MSSNQTDPNDPVQGLELSASLGHPKMIPAENYQWFYRDYNTETDYQERWMHVIAWVMLPDEPLNGRPNILGVYVNRHGYIAYTDAKGELRTREQIQADRASRR